MIGVTLNLWIKLGRTDILIVLGFPFVNVEYLFIYLSSSTLFFRILWYYLIDNDNILLDLSLNILLWVLLMYKVLLLISNSTCSLLVYIKVIDFCTIYWSCILQPCYNHLLVPEILLFILLNFLHRQSCHRQTKRVLVLSAQSVNIFSPLRDLLYWLELLVQYLKEAVRRDTLALYLTMGGRGGSLEFLTVKCHGGWKCFL